MPFFNADTSSESTLLLASPSSSAGAAVLDVTSRLWGADIHLSIPVYDGHGLRVEVLTGVRFLDFTENLNYTTASTGLAAPTTSLVLNSVRPV